MTCSITPQEARVGDRRAQRHKNPKATPKELIEGIEGPTSVVIYDVLSQDARRKPHGIRKGNKMESRGRKPLIKEHGEKYDIPDPPDHLSSEKEMKIWSHLWAENGGLLKQSDMLVVVNLCEAIKDKEYIRRKIDIDGAPPVVYINGNKTPMRNPLYNELRDLRKEINGLLSELGLTPSGRTKLNMITETNDELLSLIKAQRNDVVRKGDQ